MLSVEEARQQMLNTIPVLPTEKREILKLCWLRSRRGTACGGEYPSV